MSTVYLTVGVEEKLKRSPPSWSSVSHAEVQVSDVLCHGQAGVWAQHVGVAKMEGRIRSLMSTMYLTIEAKEKLGRTPLVSFQRNIIIHIGTPS